MSNFLLDPPDAITLSSLADGSTFIHNGIYYLKLQAQGGFDSTPLSGPTLATLQTLGNITVEPVKLKLVRE